MKEQSMPTAKQAFSQKEKKKDRILRLWQIKIRWEHLRISVDFTFNGYLMFRKSYNVTLRDKALPLRFHSDP